MEKEVSPNLNNNLKYLHQSSHMKSPGETHFTVLSFLLPTQKIFLSLILRCVERRLIYGQKFTDENLIFLRKAYSKINFEEETILWKTSFKFQTFNRAHSNIITILDWFNMSSNNKIKQDEYDQLQQLKRLLPNGKSGCKSNMSQVRYQFNHVVLKFGIFFTFFLGLFWPPSLTKWGCLRGLWMPLIKHFKTL